MTLTSTIPYFSLLGEMHLESLTAWNDCTKTQSTKPERNVIDYDHDTLLLCVLHDTIAVTIGAAAAFVVRVYNNYGVGMAHSSRQRRKRCFRVYD
jgi:hypothetical protein